ncbi:MAG: hypothetical protein WEB37_09900 [Bacteroidota bacterium]
MRNEHWTDDSELVELFVSGNMRSERTRDLEAHLALCVSCRKIVDREVLVREGIRLYARNTLKRRLRERLSLIPASGVPWPHILSAAAMLIIIVGIGIQTQWWKSAEPTLHDSDVSRADSIRSRDYPAAERSAPPAEELRAAAELSVEDRIDEMRAVETDRQLRRESVPHETQPSAGFAQSHVQQTGSIVWVTGIILTEEPTVASRADKGIFMAEKEVANVPKQLSKDIAGPRIAASQKPRRMLPLAQQAGVLGMREVVTALEEKNDSLYMTIFTDDRELQSQELRINPVTDDSIIVTSGRARIAFKIPGEMKGKIQ